MALTTFLQMQDYVLQRCGMGAERRDMAKDWINQSHRDVCEAYDWPELLKEGEVRTVAEITTGTVTVTNADATVDGSGVPDWTSPDVAGRKFAKGGVTEPWYLISSSTDADTIELSATWPHDTEAGASYSIYEDVYSLASDVDKVFTDRVTLHDANDRYLCNINHARSITSWQMPTGSGRPVYWWFVDRDSNGYKQIQIGPRVPDDVYVLRYWYKAQHTELSADGDTPQLEPSLLELVCEGALIRAYQMPEFADTDKAERQERRFRTRLRQKISDRRQGGPRGVRPRAFGSGPHRGYQIDFPVSAD